MAARSLKEGGAADSVSRETIVAARAAAESWVGFHIFYHSCRNLLLRELVRPLVGSLLCKDLIHNFFFIRYALGGPHVRLRVIPAPAGLDTVSRMVEEHSAAFFGRHPSRESLPADQIRAQNRGIVAGDPLATEDDDQAYPDNSVSRHLVGFEVDRYGGAAFLQHSLDLFALSSVQALHFAHARGDRPAGQQVADVVRIMARHAWGLARDPEEFIELAGYAVDFMGRQLPACVEEGDRIFERRRAPLRAVVIQTLDELAAGGPATDPGSPFSFADLCRAFAVEIREVDERQRWFVCASQIHMTANRLGLLTPEEVYLSRLFWRVARDLAASEPAAWKRWWQAHASVEQQPGALGRRLHQALDHLRRDGGRELG